jgi:hypothetical protein
MSLQSGLNDKSILCKIQENQSIMTEKNKPNTIETYLRIAAEWSKLSYYKRKQVGAQ